MINEIKTVNKLTPYIFENYLIIALHQDWIKLFNKIPTFTVQIDEEQRLHLISDEKIKNEDNKTADNF